MPITTNQYLQGIDGLLQVENESIDPNKGQYIQPDGERVQVDHHAGRGEWEI